MKFVAGETGGTEGETSPECVLSTMKLTWSDGDANSGPSRFLNFVLKMIQILMI